MRGRIDSLGKAAGLIATAAFCCLLPDISASARDESGMSEFVRKEARSLGTTTPRSRAEIGHAPAFPAAQSYDYGIIEMPMERRRARTGIGNAQPPSQASAATEIAGLATSHEDWMTAILRDSTLRVGDVVMFPEGPKVFRGQAHFPPWSDADFVDLSQARGMSERSRQSLLALVGRPGSLSDDAQKVRVTSREAASR